MSTFLGGPADGVQLMFHRGPMFLRVVQGPEKFDVLDQLDDEPNDDELVWVYRMVGPPRIAFLDFRDGKGRSGRYEMADYRYVELDDETRERIRDNEAWRGWVEAYVASLGTSVE